MYPAKRNLSQLIIGKILGLELWPQIVDLHLLRHQRGNDLQIVVGSLLEHDADRILALGLEVLSQLL